MPDEITPQGLDGSAQQEEAPPEVNRPASTHVGPVQELWAFLRVRKKFWLAPIIVAMMLLGLLFFLASSAGVVSPFLYAL